LITERGNLKGLANKSRYREVQEQIAEVSRALRESTKQLCRNLKDNPNISGNLIKIQKDRNDLIEALEASIKELKANGSFMGLADQVAKNREQTERMVTVVERERTMAALVTHLDHDLTEEKAAHQVHPATHSLYHIRYFNFKYSDNRLRCKNKNRILQH
jgi:L-lactate utilization protein LutB